MSTETAFWGNIDVRQDVPLGGEMRDVVAAYNGGLRLMLVDRDVRELRLANEGGAAARALGEGLCLYHDTEGGRLFAFLVQRLGLITQYRITDSDGDGLLEAAAVRTLPLSSEAEGCVADDARGLLYVGEDDVAIWRFAADPDAPSTAVAVDRVTEDGPLVSDVEGLALVNRPGGGGLLIVSVQDLHDPENSYFAVYGRVNNEFRGTFDVVDGVSADGCERTDGIAAHFGSLGPDWPTGVFICQDHENTAPGTSGAQNYKLVDLESVVDAFGPPPATCDVDNLSDAKRSSSNLQGIIDAADSGDTIRVTGVCVGTFSVDNDLRLMGEATPAVPVPTLDGDGATTVLRLSGGEKAEVVVANLTITNGSSRNGGGVRNGAGTLVLRGSASVYGNTATSCGGGVSNRGTLRLTGASSVSGNSASHCGGGIFNVRGVVKMYGTSSVVRNTARRGGGIFNDRGIVRLKESSIVRRNDPDNCRHC